jgi:hypothetical protein
VQLKFNRLPSDRLGLLSLISCEIAPCLVSAKRGSK